MMNKFVALSFSSIGSKLSLQEEKDVCAAGIQVHAADFECALDHLQATHADAIGAPKVGTLKLKFIPL